MRLLLPILVLLCFSRQSGQNVEDCGILKNENNPPWNVGLYKGTKNNDLELVCLGTSIKRNVIVTAAHCFNDQSGRISNEDFYISTKKLDRIVKPNRNLQKVDRGNIFVHSAFKGDTKHGNIAAVGLQTNLMKEESLPICIDWDNLNPFLRDREVLRHPTWLNGNLKMTDVSYIDYEECQYTSSNFFKKLITSDKICAKAGPNLGVNIDDGAGLIYLDLINNQWYLRGVVSSHDPEKTDIITYSDIILYLNWLSGIAARL